MVYTLIRIQLCHPASYIGNLPVFPIQHYNSIDTTNVGTVPGARGVRYLFAESSSDSPSLTSQIDAVILVRCSYDQWYDCIVATSNFHHRATHQLLNLDVKFLYHNRTGPDSSKVSFKEVLLIF